MLLLAEGHERSRVVDHTGFEPRQQSLRYKYRLRYRAGRSPPSRTFWWRRGDSNPLPSHCKCDALPIELRPQKKVRDGALHGTVAEYHFCPKRTVLAQWPKNFLLTFQVNIKIYFAHSAQTISFCIKKRIWQQSLHKNELMVHKFNGVSYAGARL